MGTVQSLELGDIVGWNFWKRKTVAPTPHPHPKVGMHTLSCKKQQQEQWTLCVSVATVCFQWCTPALQMQKSQMISLQGTVQLWKWHVAHLIPISNASKKQSTKCTANVLWLACVFVQGPFWKPILDLTLEPQLMQLHLAKWPMTQCLPKHSQKIFPIQKLTKVQKLASFLDMSILAQNPKLPKTSPSTLPAAKFTFCLLNLTKNSHLPVANCFLFVRGIISLVKDAKAIGTFQWNQTKLLHSWSSVFAALPFIGVVNILFSFLVLKHLTFFEFVNLLIASEGLLPVQSFWAWWKWQVHWQSWCAFEHLTERSEEKSDEIILNVCTWQVPNTPTFSWDWFWLGHAIWCKCCCDLPAVSLMVASNRWIGQQVHCQDSHLMLIWLHHKLWLLCSPTHSTHAH